MAKPRAQTLQQRLGFEDGDLKKPDHDQIMMWLDERIEAVVREIIDYHESGWPAGVVQHLRSVADNDVARKKLELESEAKRARLELENSGQNLPFEPFTMPYYSQNRLDKAIAGIAQLEPWGGLGDVVPKHWELQVRWEVPVMSGQYVIGFVDLIATAFKYKLEVSKLEKEYDQRTGVDRFVFPSFQAWRSNGIALYFEAKTAISSLGELMRQLNMYREYVPLHNGSKFVVVSPDDRYVSQLRSQNVAFVRYPDGAFLA